MHTAIKGLMPEAVLVNEDLTHDEIVYASKGDLLVVLAWGRDARSGHATYAPGKEPVGWDAFPAHREYIVVRLGEAVLDRLVPRATFVLPAADDSRITALYGANQMITAFHRGWDDCYDDEDE